jgi:hypothetical protein
MVVFWDLLLGGMIISSDPWLITIFFGLEIITGSSTMGMESWVKVIGVAEVWAISTPCIVLEMKGLPLFHLLITHDTGRVCVFLWTCSRQSLAEKVTEGQR